MGLLSNILPSKQRGNLGEESAARYLESRGFRVLERNWRYRQWELDLVCRDGDTIVFVEVKTRRSGSMASPADAMTLKKRQKLVKAASHFLSQSDLWDEPCRFDLAAVIDTGHSMDVEHTENVFDLTGMDI